MTNEDEWVESVEYIWPCEVAPKNLSEFQPQTVFVSDPPHVLAIHLWHDELGLHLIFGVPSHDYNVS